MSRILIIKTISWRIIATLVTGLVTWTLTGSLELGALVGGLDAVVKMVLYYLHERLWLRELKSRT